MPISILGTNDCMEPKQLVVKQRLQPLKNKALFNQLQNVPVATVDEDEILKG